MDDLGLNTFLKETYGSVSCDGKTMPKYRVVWSTNLTEKRLGTFNDFTESGIFIRQFHGVREVLKYPFNKDRWVLEALFYVGNDPELVASKVSYESLFIFDKAGVFLPLNRRVVEVLIWTFENKTEFTRDRVTRQHEIDDEMKRKDDEERNDILSKIKEDERSHFFGDLVY